MRIRTVIDIGANSGQFAREVSRIYPKAEIFCFEPFAGAFRELQRWANAQSERVHAINLALAEEPGERIFHLHTEHSTSSSFLENTRLNERYYPFTQKQQDVTVIVNTLDDALSGYQENMRTPILLKLDVQGYEDRVLRGGHER